MCTFGVLGLSCASPGGPVWWGRRGFTRQPEVPKRAHFKVPAFKNTNKIQRKDPKRERKKNDNCGGRKEKKERNFGRSGGGLSCGGLSGGGCPAEGCPPEGSTGNGVQGSGFRVQFRFFGSKTETQQPQNEERDE